MIDVSAYHIESVEWTRVANVSRDVSCPLPTLWE